MSAEPTPARAPGEDALTPGPVLQHEVEQFLYEEAALLDERRYEAWLGLFTADLRYDMPVRMNLTRKDEARSLTAPGELMHMEEDFAGLEMRVKRITSKAAWTESPPPRMRRLVTNVRIRRRESPVEIDVRSNFLLYRTRLERDMDLFAGERLDTLRRAPAGGGLMIARRTIHLDQTTLLASNMSLLF